MASKEKPLVKAIDLLAIWLTEGWGKNRGRALQIIGETGVELYETRFPTTVCFEEYNSCRQL